MEIQLLWWAWRTVAELKSPDPKIRKRAIHRLGYSQSVVWVKWFAVGPLVDALRQADSADMRMEAEAALVRIGEPRAVKPLVAALQDQNSTVRSSAARVLGAIGNQHAVEPLVAALQDPDSAVRLSAAQALALISDKQSKPLTIPLAIKTLVEALSDEQADARRLAASALGCSRNPLAVQALIAAQSDGNRDVRIEATRALGKIRDERIWEPLFAALKDKDHGMQEAAAYALGWTGDARAIEPLAAALTAKCMGEVQIAIVAALGQIQDAGAIQPLTLALEANNWLARERAAQALEARGWQPADDRQRALQAIAQRKWYKLETLGQTAADALVAVLANDLDGEALWTLARLGDPRAVNPILKFVNDPTQADAAVAALCAVLERAAGAVAVEDLQAVTSLNDSIPTGYWLAEGGFGGLVDTGFANCSQVKQAARQELLRRGLPA